MGNIDMDWDTAFRIVAASLASAGGAGAIIIYFIKKGANCLSERMLHKYDAKLNKNIEQYKHELELETEKYRIKSEKITFVTKIQFETEFLAYKALFDSLYDFTVYTGKLFPIYDEVPEDEEERKELYKKRYNNFCDAFNKFSEALERNAPFIPPHHYAMFDALRTKAGEISCMYPEIRIIDDPYLRNGFVEITHENHRKTVEFKDDVTKAQNTIREYLATLKVDKE